MLQTQRELDSLSQTSILVGGWLASSKPPVGWFTVTNILVNTPYCQQAPVASQDLSSFNHGIFVLISIQVSCLFLCITNP